MQPLLRASREQHTQLARSQFLLVDAPFLDIFNPSRTMSTQLFMTFEISMVEVG